MNSKSLIQNDNIVDSKASRMINDLQISLKIEHSRTTDNLHISNKERASFDDSSIRSCISSLKHFCAVINNEISRSKFLLSYRNRIASSSSTIRSFFDSTFANNSRLIWSWDKFFSDRAFYQVLSSLSNSRKIFESI
jgi:hypothetical protein